MYIAILLKNNPERKRETETMRNTAKERERQ